MQDEISGAPVEYGEGIGGASAPSIDLFAILAAVLRRWKLITAITLTALGAAYGALKLVPSLYTSTVEILVFDPQQQIDATVQKPISPFVDALGNDAMNTEIDIIKSKSVALRVARELGLDRDPEFQPKYPLAELAERLGLPGLDRADDQGGRTTGTSEEKAIKLDQAADVLRARLQVWSESYIIFVSASSQDPTKAQRLASTIANDYLASQREARQEALQRVATWLRGRVDDLHSRVLETESAIEKLKAQSGIRDGGLDNASEPQIRELNTRLMTVRAEVEKRRADLDQARHVLDGSGPVQPGGISAPSDIQSIPELAASAELTQLRQKQVQLKWRAVQFENSLGKRHAEVIAIQLQLAGINKQIEAEVEHIIGNMQSAYDIALRQQQSLESDLKQITSTANSETYDKLQQLRHVANSDRTLYESYLVQYNNVSERRTLQDATARIISAATLPRSPSSPRRKLFYILGGAAGLGGAFLLAFLLEYLWSGVKSSVEIEQSFGRPVVGIIPLVQSRKFRGTPSHRPLALDDPLLPLSQTMQAMRIGLELSNANPKAIVITSALPAEGKSTAAMLLAASSASAGRRTVLLDCDLHQQSTSEMLRSKSRLGLSELLRGSAQLADVITEDPATKAYIIPAGSTVPNPADLLMSWRMRDLVARLRAEFDYIVMDAPPLLPVVDALAVATVADKVLVIVEWGRTPRASILQAFAVLRPEAHRVAGVVLNKVSPNQLRGYGGAYAYHYGAMSKYHGRNA